MALELKQFAGENKSDLSMIEVARAILENKGAAMAFADIVNEIQQYLDKTDQEIREHLPQFYTDLNDDGDFISLGENVWGLRTWYPYDSVDEEVNHPEDVKTPKIKRVNAFLDDDEDDDDEDVIDYDDDSSDVLDDDSDDDEHIPDLSKFSSSDLDFDADDNTLPDDGLDDGIEGDLSKFSDADDTDDEDDNN